jgi:uncharacterized membrane protein YqhA
MLVLFAVVGSFISSATLMVYGRRAARSGIIITLLQHTGDQLLTYDKYGKELIAQSIALVDMFLMGTVLFIVAAGSLPAVRRSTDRAARLAPDPLPR